MHNSHLNKITYLFLFIFCFSCKTRLEKQGWQRTAVVSQLDTSTIDRKEKELLVVKRQLPPRDSAESLKNAFSNQVKSPVYGFNIFVRDSTGKIISEPFPIIYQGASNSDLAYYKWESDSVCLVKLMNHGKVQDSFKLNYYYNSKSLTYLNGPK